MLLVYTEKSHNFLLEFILNLIDFHRSALFFLILTDTNAVVIIPIIRLIVSKQNSMLLKNQFRRHKLSLS